MKVVRAARVASVVLFVTAMAISADAGTDTSISFAFVNSSITAGGGNYEVDVSIAAGENGTKIGDCMVYINYSTAGFGSFLFAKNKIVVTKGVLIQGDKEGADLYSIIVADNTSSRVAITVEYNFSSMPGWANNLLVSQAVLLHIKIDIADSSKTSGLSFQQNLMDNNQYQSDYNKYNPVKTGDGDDASLPVSLSVFTANTENNSIIVKWRTETEVNNIGFSIYRSEKKDSNYIKISFVSGAGNTGMPTDYEFLDTKVEPGKTYFYYLEDIDITGKKNKSDIIKVVVPAKSVILIPKYFALFQNYPNPFNPETWMPFQLAKAGWATIQIYNLTGHLVKTIELGYKQADIYVDKSKAAYWDGRNNMGERVASGIYFYHLKSGKFSATRKMIILK